MATYTVAAEEVYVFVGDNMYTEFADGDLVTISLAGDDTTITEGARGAGAVGFLNNKKVEVSFNLLQGSSDNSRLSADAKAILDAKAGSKRIVIKDGRGESLLVISQGFPKKRPDWTVSNEPGSVEHMWHGIADVFNVGGNVLA